MALDPGRAEVLAARARIYYAQQKYDDAVAYARLAIERKPDCEGAYNVLGRAYFASDRFEEAALIVEQALEANGDDYNTYIPYLMCLERLGRKAEEMRVRERLTRALERQLELVPDDVRARILLAVQWGAMSPDRRGGRAAPARACICGPMTATRCTTPRASTACSGGPATRWTCSVAPLPRDTGTSTGCVATRIWRSCATIRHFRNSSDDPTALPDRPAGQ